ncbi:MAG: hypothetical protein EOM34_04450 [Clostridia bacterium]|nr:hypothetical protein [Lachnospiraceae bacterium]NCB99919.1 hypothetical protein [Clostridia bacterium]NCD04032.1 hypothetical protein [Clostridia bacterium]
MKTALKVTSVLQIISGILGIIGAILLFLGGGLLGAASMDAVGASQSTGMVLTGMALVLAIVALFSGIFSLVCGIKGYKGANGDLGKLKTALVLGWISLVLCIISAISTLLTGHETKEIIQALVGLIVPVLFVVSATSVKNELEQ